jgi:hypothetical protein
LVNALSVGMVGPRVGFEERPFGCGRVAPGVVRVKLGLVVDRIPCGLVDCGDDGAGSTRANEIDATITRPYLATTSTCVNEIDVSSWSASSYAGGAAGPTRCRTAAGGPGGTHPAEFWGWWCFRKSVAAQKL